MEPFEKNCPIPSTHAKCAEAEYFLMQCLFHYHAPNQFIYNLNAFIQAFRNITFMLQSEDIKPESFQEWYQSKQTEMRSVPMLRRLVEARNIVVKQSSLKAKSTVMCGLFRGRRMKLSMKKDIQPFTDSIKILDITTKFIVEFFLGGEHLVIGEQAGVERAWIVEELGEHEVMSQCIEAMNFMIGLIEEAHSLMGCSSGFRAISVNLSEFSVLLETDVDPTLFSKWGWLES